MVDIGGLQRNTARYEFSDGIRDFQNAFWLLVMGLYAWIVFDMPEAWLPAVRDFSQAQGSAFVVILMFVFGIGIPLIISEGGLRLVNEYIRRRWLWRETGFIKSKSWIIPRMTLFIAFIVTFAVFIGGIFVAMRLDDPWLIFKAIWIAAGVQYAFMYWSISRQLDITRYQWVALAGLVGTVAITPLPLGAGLFCLVVSVFWAILLAISGVYAMRQMAATQQALADAA